MSVTRLGVQGVVHYRGSVGVVPFGKAPAPQLSRPARKPTLWSLRNVSTRISMPSPRRLIRAETFRLWGEIGIE